MLTLMDQHMMSMWSRRLLEEANRTSAFAKFLGPAKPLTRMQKLRNRLSMYGRRFSDAWAMLRGEYDCGC